MTDGNDAAPVAMSDAHRVASLLKRWLLGSHQDAAEPQHLDAYLNEFTLRLQPPQIPTQRLLLYRLLDQAAHTPPALHKAIIGGKS